MNMRPLTPTSRVAHQLLLAWSLLSPFCKDANAQNPGATLSDPTDGGRMGWRETQYPAWGQPEYYEHLKLNYKYRNTQIGNDVKAIYYVTELRVDPCRQFLRTGAKGEMCCNDMNAFGCQDHPNDIVGGADLQVAYFQNAHIPSCMATVFEKDPNCGASLEIHRKDQVYPVIVDVRITDDMPNGFQTTFLGTANLCVGDYELWFVVRTRAGPFVEARKDFRVRSPSCREPTQDDIIAQEEEQGDGIGVIVGRMLGRGGENSTSATGGGSTSSRKKKRSKIPAHLSKEIREMIKDGNRRARLNREKGWVLNSAEWQEREEDNRRRLQEEKLLRNAAHGQEWQRRVRQRKLAEAFAVEKGLADREHSLSQHERDLGSKMKSSSSGAVFRDHDYDEEDSEGSGSEDGGEI
ncbi:unnamed protein product [Amoebophrya sp. A25]|nr:unnamed protein product [Amoebophrya sp. A25]|eukprot:GSA25T00020954001.1